MILTRSAKRHLSSVETMPSSLDSLWSCFAIPGQTMVPTRLGDYPFFFFFFSEAIVFDYYIFFFMYCFVFVVLLLFCLFVCFCFVFFSKKISKFETIKKIISWPYFLYRLKYYAKILQTHWYWQDLAQGITKLRLSSVGAMPRSKLWKKNKTNVNGPISWTEWNSVIKFCIHIDIGKI